METVIDLPVMQTSEETGLTRYQQSLAREPHKLVDEYGEDAKTAQMVLIYLCHNVEMDLFQTFKLDPTNFAKSFNMNPSYFRRSVPKEKLAQYIREGDVKFKQLEEDPDKYIFDSKLENALYKLMYSPIPLRIPRMDVGSHNKYTEAPIQFLEKVEIFEDKKNRNKKYYIIKPSAQFIQQFANLFIQLKKDVYSKLIEGRKNNLGDLYMRIIFDHYKAQMNNKAYFSENFNDLTKIVGVSNYKSHIKKKEKLNEYLKIVQNEIQSHFSFDFKWNKYVPVFIFRDLDQSVDTKKQRKQTFYILIDYFLHYTFTEYYTDEVEKDYESYFQRWMADHDKDVKLKIQAYTLAYRLNWNRDLSDEKEALDYIRSF